jgi:hypothetical protein
MKRVAGILVGGYLFLALGTRVAEAMGARKCHCAQDCWCQQPLLSAFRWVFPWPHRNDHGHDDDETALDLDPT